MTERALRRARAWLALVFVAATACPDTARSEPPHGSAPPGLTVDDRKAAGFYLYMAHPDLPHFEHAYTTSLAKPYIDGLAVMLEWQKIEPASGVFDWQTLDRWISQAVRAGKQLSIGTIAGPFTPDWLYRQGQTDENSFSYNRSSVGFACTVFHQPSAWNTGYLREYGKLMMALSGHLHSMTVPDTSAGSVYRALRVVKLSGINNTTEELRVDTTKPDEGPCHQSDATAIWLHAGFRPAKIAAAFMSLAELTQRAFPDKLLSVAVIHKNAFPPIGDDGERYDGITIPDALTGRLLNEAVPVYGKQLLVQWNALWQGPPPPEVEAAAAKGASIGWQMNGFLGPWGGSGCIYPGWAISACKQPQDFTQILLNGMNRGARYIEVQVGSVATGAWDQSFSAAHEKLARGE